MRIFQSPLWQVVHREVLRIYKSKVLLFSSIFGPLLSLVLVALIFEQGVVHELPVAVVDKDHSQLSQKLTRMLHAAPIADVAVQQDLQSAYRDMRLGKNYAIVEIPEDFERSILRNEQPEIALHINNANVVKGGLLYSGLYRSLATFTGGVKLNVRMKKGATEEQALQSVQAVRLDTHLLFNPFGNYAYFLTLGLSPLMLIVFIFLTTVYALGIELKTGSAPDYLRTADNSIIVALTGKMLPYTLLFFMNMMVMNLLLFQVLGTPLQGNLVVLLFAEFLIIVVYQLVAIALLAMTSNMRLTLSLGSAYTLMAMTFAGITFPLVGMPLVARVFSWIFPYTFWIKIFIGQSIKGQPVAAEIPDFLRLLLFIILGLLSFRTLKRKLSNEKYWGKA